MDRLGALLTIADRLAHFRVPVGGSAPPFGVPDATPRTASAAPLQSGPADGRLPRPLQGLSYEAVGPYAFQPAVVQIVDRRLNRRMLPTRFHKLRG